MSNLEAELSTIATTIRDHSETISTEEAAKNSLVLPFFNALGFSVFNPSEFVPEFTADTPGKRGEKVDFAIKLDGAVSILVECKGLSTSLHSKHRSQLYRYFMVTDAKFAILTNGRTYEFYSDLEDPNKLDEKPFFQFDLLEFGAPDLRELEKFQKSNFDIDSILANAERLKFVSATKRFLAQQFESPGDEFVRLVANNVHDGRVTASVREMVASTIRRAFRDLINEKLKSRISSALDVSDQDGEDDEHQISGIETTQEEIEGMLTVRSIVRSVIDAERVDLRDAKSYCAVLIDDNNRKPLARLHFNTSQKYLGLFDGESEERVKIDGLTDILKYSERLCETARRYA